MSKYFEIQTPKDLVEFAEKFGFSIDEHEELEIYGLSTSGMGENITLHFKDDLILMLVISKKGLSEWNDCYTIKDWNGVEFCLSQILMIKIEDGELFLMRV